MNLELRLRFAKNVVIDCYMDIILANNSILYNDIIDLYILQWHLCNLENAMKEPHK